MEATTDALLCSHLADFETTTSDQLRAGQAIALLNFAALFHEVIYLPDTALGDHELIIKSFQQNAHTGLFQHLRSFIEKGILRVLVRDKVVVSGEVRVASNPTISEIFEGWRHRDKTKWKGERGYTVEIPDRLRRAYCREADSLVAQPGVVQRYDPDIVKASFRQMIREQIGSSSSRLAESVSHLPRALQRQYREALTDPWFTNAELWRVLRKAKDPGDSLVLHGHINQQCFANIVAAGQSVQDNAGSSLASFNLELQRKQPFTPEIEATLNPPKSLEELLERASIVLSSPGVEMFEHLSVVKVMALRRRANKVFEIARRHIEPSQLEDLRDEYLKALEKYWEFILQTFETMYPEQMRRPSRLGIFLEDQVPALDWLYKRFGRSLFTLLLRVKLGPAAGTATDAASQVGVVILQERTALNESIRSAIPPGRWYRRAILGLSRLS